MRTRHENLRGVGEVEEEGKDEVLDKGGGCER